MRLRNKHGAPVDPVPFLVVATGAFAVSFTFGPLYLMALGLDVGSSLVVCGVVVVVAAAGAYHRLVRNARPDLGEVPAAARLERLLYAVLICVVALVLLALPLLVR